jgi:OmpA-OmpF porin, OOP family
MTERGVIGGGIAAFVLLCVFCVWHHWGQWNQAAPVAAATQLPAPRLQAVFDPPRIVLSGSVPDEAARQSILQRANSVYGAANVTDQLMTAPVAATSWFAPNAAAFPPDLRQTLRARALLAGGKLRIEGETASAQLRDQVAQAAAPVAPATLDNALSVSKAAAIAQDIGKKLELKIVEFQSGSDQLTPNGKATLDELLPLFAQDPAARFLIEGHTDNRGDPKANQSLSERRAQTVRDYLAEKGVARARFETAGKGDAQPVADNNTAAGRQKNRRIEFKPLVAQPAKQVTLNLYS